MGRRRKRGLPAAKGIAAGGVGYGHAGRLRFWACHPPSLPLRWEAFTLAGERDLPPIRPPFAPSIRAASDSSTRHQTMPPAGVELIGKRILMGFRQCQLRLGHSAAALYFLK